MYTLLNKANKVKTKFSENNFSIVAVMKTLKKLNKKENKVNFVEKYSVQQRKNLLQSFVCTK